MFLKYTKIYFLLTFSLIILICIFILPKLIQNNIIIQSPQEFFWPTPNFHTITSNFGYRSAPTIGASTYHSGIDIAAPENSEIHSICEGIVSFCGFKGAGGYTITISAKPYAISYCHMSPNFKVLVGEYVAKKEIIGNVGAKYIESIPNNPYTDSTGKQTNGATTGPHLHLTIKYNDQAIDPLSLFP